MDNTSVLDPTVRKFVDELEARHLPPLSSLTPDQARAMLTQTQSVPVSIPQVNISTHIVELKMMDKMHQVMFYVVKPVTADKKLLPIVMYFHGGGWVMGDFNIYRRVISEIAAQTGYAVVFVEYHRSPEEQWPIAINECYHVTEHLTIVGEKYGLDGKKIIVVGDSAGGNLAIAVTMWCKKYAMLRQAKQSFWHRDRTYSVKIAAQVLLYPVISDQMNTNSYNKYQNGPWLTKDSMQWFWNSYAPQPGSRNYADVNPLLSTLEALQGLPPAAILVAEHDVLHDEGVEYAYRLKQAGVNVMVAQYPGAIHDFVMLNPLAESQVAKDALADVVAYIKNVKF